MTDIMTRRETSSSDIAFAWRAKAYAATRIIAISRAANTRRAKAFTASWNAFWDTDATITMAYRATRWRAYIA